MMMPERWVFCLATVPAATEDASETAPGFKRRTRQGPFTGHILEHYTKDGDPSPKLQPTGDSTTFFSYWLGEIPPKSLIRIKMDHDGRYYVHGADCASGA
ncbi:hypothetical protein [Roseiconus lacunae]|uniref:Uncharacterized protein n=1 Tax=Roseiconus lacunae TaxID=2605694 RepID=A0ABT7PH98_9BACT|nr:hypothetical protein [Roseiconus lacunae]MDM4015865.1 hypothetical protein [Roseiconus lacunae]